MIIKFIKTRKILPSLHNSYFVIENEKNKLPYSENEKRETGSSFRQCKKNFLLKATTKM